METTRHAERKALAYLARLTELYENAYATAVQLPATVGSDGNRTLLLEKLQESIVATTCFEQAHQEERSFLLTSEDSRSHAAQRQLAHLRSVIEKLLQAVATAERAAVEARSNLVPELDEQTKARQVRMAYGAAKANE